jgi:hypothetical protein
MPWCYYRLVNGPEDSVWVKYQVLKERHKEPITQNEVSAMGSPPTYSVVENIRGVRNCAVQNAALLAGTLYL